MAVNSLLWVCFLLTGYASCLTNGLLPSLESFSTAAYSTRTFHLAVTLSGITGPIVAVVVTASYGHDQLGLWVRSVLRRFCHCNRSQPLVVRFFTFPSQSNLGWPTMNFNWFGITGGLEFIRGRQSTNTSTSNSNGLHRGRSVGINSNTSWCAWLLLCRLHYLSSCRISFSTSTWRCWFGILGRTMHLTFVYPIASFSHFNGFPVWASPQSGFELV